MKQTYKLTLVVDGGLVDEAYDHFTGPKGLRAVETAIAQELGIANDRVHLTVDDTYEEL
jgi:hypothetical protein